MPNPRPFLLAFAFCLIIAAAAPAGDPFLDLTVDEALARAKTEEKLVFIDFFADWCNPCKQLDDTTFADEKVVEWLGNHTIPVKVDVDRNTDLAKRFLVRSMPTLIFLKPDGTEMQRLKGYQASDQFLSAAEAVVEHPEKDAVARAREELETGHWPEAMARHKLATALAVGGKKEAALGEYLKAMDSLGTDPMSRRYRPQLVIDLCSLARDYPPARETLAAQREKLVQRLESGKADRQDVKQILLIDQGLEQREKSLELYTHLKKEGSLPSDILSAFARDCRELMLAERHYEVLEAESPGGVLFNALQAIQMLERQRVGAAGDFSGMSEESAAMMRQRLESMGEEGRAAFAARLENEQLTKIGELYQIALGVGKADDAAVIARKFLESTPTAQAYHILAVNALSSGRATEADLGYAKQAVEQDGGAHSEYAETRDQLLEQLAPAGEVPAGEAAGQG